MSPTMNTAIFNAHLKHLNREWYQKCNLMKIFNIPAIKKKIHYSFYDREVIHLFTSKMWKEKYHVKRCKGENNVQ